MNTSLEFSKQLKEAGCELKSRLYHHDIIQYEIDIKGKSDNINWLGEYNDWHSTDEKDNKIFSKYKYPAYDILNDICVEYKEEFWGKDYLRELKKIKYRYRNGSEIILRMLQQSKPLKEIEKYIWDNTIYNPKNK